MSQRVPHPARLRLGERVSLMISRLAGISEHCLKVRHPASSVSDVTDSKSVSESLTSFDPIARLDNSGILLLFDFLLYPFQAFSKCHFYHFKIWK